MGATRSVRTGSREPRGRTDASARPPAGTRGWELPLSELRLPRKWGRTLVRNEVGHGHLLAFPGGLALSALPCADLRSAPVMLCDFLHLSPALCRFIQPLHPMPHLLSDASTSLSVTASQAFFDGHEALKAKLSEPRPARGPRALGRRPRWCRRLMPRGTSRPPGAHPRLPRSPAAPASLRPPSSPTGAPPIPSAVGSGTVLLPAHFPATQRGPLLQALPDVEYLENIPIRRCLSPGCPRKGPGRGSGVAIPGLGGWGSPKKWGKS